MADSYDDEDDLDEVDEFDEEPVRARRRPAADDDDDYDEDDEEYDEDEDAGPGFVSRLLGAMPSFGDLKKPLVAVFSGEPERRALKIWARTRSSCGSRPPS